MAKSAPPLKKGEFTSAEDEGYVEDLHETTRQLLRLRFQDPIPSNQWKTKMAETLGQFVVKLAKGLDRAGIYGDVLGFLPDSKKHPGSLRHHPERGRGPSRRLRADLDAASGR